MKFNRMAVAGAAILALDERVRQSPMAKNPMVGGAPMYANKNDRRECRQLEGSHDARRRRQGRRSRRYPVEGPGPFTVFAPTNEAFKKLPAGTVDNLLKPENKGQLQAVLTYHVVPGLADLQGTGRHDQGGRRQGRR